MPADHPLRPKATLTSLPIEIITHIILLLDLKTALSLARVAPAFTALADRRIWRELDLYLPPDYGYDPKYSGYYRSFHRHNKDPRKAKAQREEDRRAEDRHREGVRTKVQRILMAGDARRLGMVEKVTLVPRPRALNAMLAIVDLVSPRLKTLHLEAATWPHYIPCNTAATWRPAEEETFDHRVLGYGLSFPALTSLTLGRCSFRYLETFLILGVATPNLISLEIDLEYVRHGSPSRYGKLSFLPPGHDGKPSFPSLRQLHLSCFPYQGRQNSILDILNSSQQLQQVTCLIGGNLGDASQNAIKVLSTQLGLKDLVCNLEMGNFMDAQDEEHPGFLALKKLRLWKPEDPWEIFEYLPTLPALEILCVEDADPTPNANDAPPLPFPSSSSTFSMLLTFARQLRKCPKLTTLNTSGRKSCVIGTIRSFLRGDEEILHARLFGSYLEKADYPLPYPPDPLPRDDPCIDYTDAGGSRRRKILEPDGKDQWLDFTDYAGYAVPLETVEEMRIAQGAAVDEWQGRGVEVGDEAWQVLEDWRTRKEAE